MEVVVTLIVCFWVGLALVVKLLQAAITGVALAVPPNGLLFISAMSVDLIVFVAIVNTLAKRAPEKKDCSN